MTFSERYGPWAIIVGASEGIGAAWAHALARRGLNVVLVARREQALKEVAEAIKKAHGVQVATVVADAASPDLMTAIEAVDHDIGLYVHNAAYSPGGDFLKRQVADQLKAVDVNVRAPVLLSHFFGQKFVARGRGGIVLMSSLTALQGTPNIATYGATKSFNLALGEALHSELKPLGVDVLVCCAGATLTRPYLEVTRPAVSPGELEPEAVVEAALRQLGKRAYMIPGAFNRFAAFAMSRLLSRATAIKILASQTKKLKVLP